MFNYFIKKHIIKRWVLYFVALLAIVALFDYKNSLLTIFPFLKLFGITGIINTSSDLIYFWTLLAIFLYVRETHKSTKYLEYQSRPTAYFLLFKSLIYIKNTSNFLVKFYFKMSLEDKTLNDNHWMDNKDGPLYIYPGDKYMQYPSAFNVSKLTTGEIKIEYQVVPSHINDTELYKDAQIIKWKYDTNSKKWRGPNGISEEGVLGFLSKETRYGLVKAFPELTQEYPSLFPTNTGRKNHRIK